MPSIVLTDAEWDCLAGEPGDLLKLYVGLRRRMDFASGVVGLVTRLKEQVFRDLLTVDAVRGRHTPPPVTRKRWRAAIARLCSLGLLVDCGNFVFELPCALTDKLVQNMRGQSGANERTAGGGVQRPVSNGWKASAGKVLEVAANVAVEGGAGVMVVGGGADEGHTSASPVIRKKRECVGGKAGAVSRPAARGSRVPVDFVADEQAVALAKGYGLDVATEQVGFVSYYLGCSRPVLSPDWQARFRKWLVNAVQFRAASGSRASAKGLAPAARSAGVSNGRPWFLTAKGIELKAMELGFAPPPGVPLGLWKQEVFSLAGLSEEEYRRGVVDFA